MIELGWIEQPQDIPADAIPEDPMLLNQGWNLENPVCYYADNPFYGIDCGSREVWKAKDQM